VFSEVLRHRNRLVAGVIRVITARSNTPKILGQSFWAGRALGQGLLSPRVGAVWMGISQLITLAAAFGSIAGLWMSIVYAMGWQSLLQSAWLLTPAVILSGLWLGFQARILLAHFTASPLFSPQQREKPLTVSGVSEAFRLARHDMQTSINVSRVSATTRLIGVAGLLVNLVVLSRYETSLSIGWAAAVSVLGWMLADRMSTLRGRLWVAPSGQQYE
jgi:hypothetical protein